MQFYLTQSDRSNFNISSTKKEALTYKKEHDSFNGDTFDQCYTIKKITIKNKKELISFINSLDGGPDSTWDEFY
tara:strand:- start:107 stop:328 length:222 start_codon:yes stop_codon:yes gene_type:complete